MSQASLLKKSTFLDLVLPASEFPKPGIYVDVPEETYHADKTAVSNSFLTEFRRSPQHGLYWQEFGSAETKFDIFGRALHCYALEPKSFYLKYAVKKKVDGRTTAGRTYNEKFSVENGGKGIINEEEYLQIQAMAEALFSNEYFSRITASGFPEVTVVWVDEESGIKCRGRLDWVREDGIIYDLKGISGCHPSEMKSKAFNFSYHFQSTMYGDGFSKLFGKQIETYVLGTVEKDKPHEVANYAFDDETIRDTRIRYKKNLIDLKECRDKGVWPGYPKDLITLEAPRWLSYE